RRYNRPLNANRRILEAEVTRERRRANELADRLEDANREAEERQIDHDRADYVKRIRHLQQLHRLELQRQRQQACQDQLRLKLRRQSTKCNILSLICRALTRI